MNWKTNDRYVKRMQALLVMVMVAAGVCAPDANAGKRKEYRNAPKCRRVIKDSELFGVFKGETWAVKPLLNYGYTTKLLAVERAAKAGDYETAAAELLAYYQKQPTDPKMAPKGERTLRVQLWEDKIFGFDQQLKLLDVVAVPASQAKVSLDVPGEYLKGGFNTFMLMGRKKNGVVSCVASRESATQPVLNLKFKDGSSTPVLPNADTYIRAGKHVKNNYGKVKALEVCNSGLKSNQPFDDDTRRTFISFDLKGVDPESIASASLTMNAWAVKPDQHLIVFYVKPTVVAEESMNWANDLGYIYSWEGLRGGVDWNPPMGAHGQFHNWLLRLYWLDPMTGWACSSDDPRAGRITLDLLRDFMADNPGVWLDSYLNVTSRAKYFRQCVPYLFRLEACTPRDCVEIIKTAFRDGTSLYLDEHNSLNQGFSVVDGLHQIGISFPEIIASESWLASAKDRLEMILGTIVLDDGAYAEHCFGYAFHVLTQMTDLAELYTTHGMSPPKMLASKTQQLARYLVFCSLPDGEMPKWGEGVGQNSQDSKIIKRVARVLNDPELTWWTTKGKEGRLFGDTNVHYPEARVIVMREGWSPDENYLFFSPRIGGGHYHCDQNTLILFAHGQPLLNDTGMSSYDSSHPHFDWQRHQTRSHNTVEVDEKGFPRLPKSKEEGPCHSEMLVSAHAVLAKGWAEGYPTIRHARNILHLRGTGLYLVHDLLTPKDQNQHTYDINWHIHPDNSFAVNPRTFETYTTNKDKANLRILPIWPAKPEVLKRKGFNAVPLTDKTYVSYRQKGKGDAVFLTILHAVPGKISGAVKTKALKATGGAKAVEIRTEAGSGILIAADNVKGLKKTVARQGGDLETDADLAYVQFGADGTPEWAVRSGGTMLRVNGQAIACETMAAPQPPKFPSPSNDQE